MLEQVYSEVKKSLHSAESLYYSLVLLVGQSGTRKSKILNKISKYLLKKFKQILIGDI